MQSCERCWEILGGIQEQHVWKCWKGMRMWHLEIWFSGEQSGAGLAVGPDDLRGLFQPE